MRPLLAALLVLSACLPAQAAAAPPRLGRAVFHGETGAIEIPYTGRAPKATLYRLTSTHYYYEFEPAVFGPGGAQQSHPGKPLEAFTIAKRPRYDAVRLSFRTTEATVPMIKVDPRTRRIRVLPLGRVAKLGSAPARVPHNLKLR